MAASTVPVVVYLPIIERFLEGTATQQDAAVFMFCEPAATSLFERIGLKPQIQEQPAPICNGDDTRKGIHPPHAMSHETNGQRWRCRKQLRSGAGNKQVICGKSLSCDSSSFVARTRLENSTLFCNLWDYFAMKTPRDFISRNLKVSPTTASLWVGYIKEILSDAALIQFTDHRLGGIGKFVQVDETIEKRAGKNYKGRKPAAPPVLMIVECEHHLDAQTKQTDHEIHHYKAVKIFCCRIPSKERKVIGSILERIILPNTAIITDGHASYGSLEGHNGWSHRKVNHSLCFVDPDDRSVHTQTVERVNRSLRENIVNFTNNHDMDLDIHSFMFQFNNFTADTTVSQKILIFAEWAKKLHPGIGGTAIKVPHWVHFQKNNATKINFPYGVVEGTNILGKNRRYWGVAPEDDIVFNTLDSDNEENDEFQ